MQNDKPVSQQGIFLFVITMTLTIPKTLASAFLKLMDWLRSSLDLHVFIIGVFFLGTLDVLGLETVFLFYSIVTDFAFSFPNPFMQAFLIILFAYLSLTFIAFNIFLLAELLGRFVAGYGSSGKDQFKLQFKEKAFLKARESQDKNKSFLGISRTTRRPLYLTEEMRLMHTQVVGSTGAGKTESVLLPLVARDIRMKRGLVFIDAKGDQKTLAKVYGLVKKEGRESKFKLFSFSYPEKSFTYNPLKFGSYTEVKDRLMGFSVWTEEYYRKRTADILQFILKCMEEAKRPVTFESLRLQLESEEALEELEKSLAGESKRRLSLLTSNFSKLAKDLSGFISDLGAVADSRFNFLLNQEEAEIDLLRAYKENEIVYFQLNTQGFQETAKGFGRLILQDLKTLSNFVQAYIPEDKRVFFPVFIDEFASFAYRDFIELLNKARAAGMAITLSHQSLGDLEAQGRDFQKQIIENTNIKIILRQDSPDSIETFARIAGTRRSVKETIQTEESLFGKSNTGLGTTREVDVFLLEPNYIRGLNQGEAALIIKAPKNETHFVKLDYLKDLIPCFELPDRGLIKNPAALPGEAEEKESDLDKSNTYNNKKFK